MSKSVTLMAKPNFKNRTLWTGDNLHVMRGLNSETVDLIYLDPPFNSNKNYAAPIGSEAAGAAFKDTWTLSDVDLAWHGEIAEANPGLYRVIDAAREAHGKGMQSYLIMMAVRLLEMQRLLKPTGSVYLHCDPTASHYLKMVMDTVFGHLNFINEVVWYYRGAGVPKTARARRHDNILLYAKQHGSHYFDPDPIRLPYADATVERSRHYIGNVRGGADFGQQELNPKGKHPDDVITHIQPIAPSAKARLGYPTQKPIKLLQDLIESSSQKDAVVLDPFCGCATALVASEKLQRQWIGIDLSPKAKDLIRSRIRGELGLFGVNTVYRNDVPMRTDQGKLPAYQTHKHTLYGQQEGRCAGCNTLFDIRNFAIDHVVARSKGGTDHLNNLQLLCGMCNSMKGVKTQEEFLAILKREGIR